MSVFGIDFGNLNSTVAITRYGGVDIVTNEVSKRETTTIVSFFDEERFIGEQGLDRYVRNAQNTVFLIKRFIGMRMDDPQLEQEKRFLTCGIEGDDEGRLMFTVTYCDEVHRFYPEQVLAMMLQRLRSYVNEAATTDSRFPADVKDFVITVPSYYTHEQRRLMYQAADAAGLHCMSLVNETTASAVDYGIFRGASLKDVEEEGQVVGILDIGYAATDFSICRFWKGNCKVLARTFDRNNGTRDCDYLLYQQLAKEVQDKYKVDVTENRRARLRLLQACEKLKYLLSANQSAPLNVENLMDIDVNIPNFERATMESLCAGVRERIHSVMQRGFEESGVAAADFHSLEMIGGGCRIPMFKKLVEEVFGRTPSFTLNASETTARGCAIIAATLSPKFQVRPFHITELPTYPIVVGYHAEDPKNPVSVPFLPEVNKVVKLLGTTDSYPKTLTVRMPMSGVKLGEDVKVFAFLDPEHPNVQALVPPQHYVVGEWSVGTPSSKPRGAFVELRVHLKIKEDGLLEMTKAEAMDRYESEEAAPAKEGEDAEGEKEKKVKEAVVSVTMKPNLEVLGHPSDRVVQFRRTEADMHDRDCRIIRTREKKNELESYILDFRPRLSEGGLLAAYATPEQVQKFVQQCTEDESWLYEDGEAASYEDYAQRVKALRVIGDAAARRHKVRDDAEFALRGFQDRMALAKDKALKKVGQAAHISEEELQAAAATATAAVQWALAQAEAMRKTPTTEESPLSSEDLERKAQEVEQGIQRVLNKPVPKPKKEEEEKPKEKEEEKNEEAEAAPAPEGEAAPAKDELD